MAEAKAAGCETVDRPTNGTTAPPRGPLDDALALRADRERTRDADLARLRRAADWVTGCVTGLLGYCSSYCKHLYARAWASRAKEPAQPGPRPRRVAATLTALLTAPLGDLDAVSAQPGRRARAMARWL